MQRVVRVEVCRRVIDSHMEHIDIDIDLKWLMCANIITARASRLTG
jgi:hypothetical protein